jgi:hypothetical protein
MPAAFAGTGIKAGQRGEIRLRWATRGFYTKNTPRPIAATGANVSGVFRRNVVPIMRTVSILLATSLFAALTGTARADIFVLNSGGRVSGTWVNADDRLAGQYVVETSAGRITLAREQVKQVIRQRPEELEYERIAPTYPDTVEGQWTLAEWCRERHLSSHRQVHLRRIVALAPDHADARRALGYSFIDGQWLTQQEFLDRNGLVRYRGMIVTPQEVELLERRRKDELAEKEWFTKLRRIRSQLDRDRNVDAARSAITSIDDPYAVKAILSQFDDEKVRDVRLWYIAALAGIGSPDAVAALVKFSLEDKDAEIRISSLERLAKFKGPAVTQRYVQALKDKDNDVVQRAALGLRYAGDGSAVVPLIDALVTTHTYLLVPHGANTNPGAITSTFSTAPGGGGMGFGMNMNRTRKIKRDISNTEVLKTLVELTSVNYSFDKDAWRKWFTAQRQPESLDARRD